MNLKKIWSLIAMIGQFLAGCVCTIAIFYMRDVQKTSVGVLDWILIALMLGSVAWGLVLTIIEGGKE